MYISKVLRWIKRKLIDSNNPYGWFGNYPSYESANKECGGYESGLILTRVSRSLAQVRDGKAKYERDSVLLGKVDYSFGLLSGLLLAATSNNGHLHLVDFGGSLGSSYYQNRTFFKHLNQVKWIVVEQTNFVEEGIKNFQNQNLHFAFSINEALTLIPNHTLLLSSVLQYLDDPYASIDSFIEKGFSFILIDRTSFIYSPNERITIQKVPPEIYQASYPCYFFNEEKFLKKFGEKYEVLAEFPSFCDSDNFTEDGTRLYWKGFILKLKE
jgi:putative methyltransferase (TIGR04325 family)